MKINEKITSNSSVSSVSSSSAFLSLVDLSVSNNQFISIKTLDLFICDSVRKIRANEEKYVGVGFKILEKSKDDLAGLSWPSTYIFPSELLILVDIQ